MANSAPAVRVPFVDLGAQHRSVEADVEEAVLSVLRSGRYVLGAEVERFERQLARYSESRHAVGVASGTDGLVLALSALGVGDGDGVVTTPFTFFATAAAIVRVGAKPVFVDVEPNSFNLNPELIPGVLSDRIRAVLPVHLFGLAADVAAIRKQFSGPIVADAAQALGARFDGEPLTSLAEAAVISFFPTKNLGAAGDAGAVLTDDSAIDQNLRRLRAHGAVSKYHHESVGLNSRLDALQAAILSVKLGKLEEWTRRRRAIAARYSNALADIDFLRLPDTPSRAEHVFHQYTLRVLSGRDELASHLRERGIETIVNYPIPLHMQPALSFLGYRSGDFPVAEELARSVLSLPCSPELSEEQQEIVIGEIHAFRP